MTPKLKLKLGLVLLSVATLAGLALAAQMNVFAYPDSSLGDKSPWPANSYMSGQDGLIHVHYLRKQGATNGSQPYIELKAYYPKDISDRDWNQARLTFSPGNPLNDEHVCDKEATGMNSPNKFIYVEIKTGDTANKKITYWIPAANACTQQNHDNENGARSTNVFYGSYALPDKPDLDVDTNKYVADVTISYSDEVPQGNNGIRFLVRGDGGNPKIGPLGSLTGNTSFSIIADWGLHDLNNQTAAAMTIPFGLPCSVTRNVSNAKVRIYDADNGTGFAHTVSFRVKNLDTGRYVTFTGKGSQNPNAGPGQWGDGGTDRTTYIPPAGSGNTVKAAWAEMGTFETDTHYQMEISGIDMRNTIDVGVPGDPINGTVRCGWRMKPVSAVNTDEVAPGATVTFTHTASNKGAFDTPNDIDITAKWGPDPNGSGRSKITSGNVVQGFLVTAVDPQNPIANKSYTADENDRNNSRTITTKVVIPANAVDGDMYCQYLRVNHHSDKDSGSIDSDTACVTVRRACAPPDPACPAPTKKVLVQAYVNGGPDAETTTTATFTGGVAVSQYPDVTDGGWGYNSRATEVFATRTTAQQTINGTSASTSRVTYTCPSGYTPSNPTSYSYYSCSRTVNETTCPSGYSPTGNQCYRILWASTYYSNGSWRCPSGYGSFVTPAAGGQCFKIEYVPAITNTTTSYSYPNSLYEYNYFCTQTNTWSGWTTTGSPCRNYYVCPGGATAGAGWYTSASGLSCNSWQCLYAASPYDNTIYMGSTPPKCEWRCAGASGSIPLQAGRRPYLAQNTANKTGTGELRCFTQPSFQLICKWDTGATTTATVTGNGNYCQNTSTSKPAGSIGSVVYATLTPSQQGGWQPSDPQPGYIANSSGGGTTRVAIWGWDFRPGTNSANVVGMPYVKVYAGDVRVGGGVGATTQTCTPNNNARIKTYSNGVTGSGTQFAAFASGFIDRFVSGQYNPLGANPDAGSMPTKLTFANNAGGSGYGGGFGTAGACYNYVEKLPEGTQPTVGNTPINGHGIGVGHKEVLYIKGNAYINGNISYNNGTRSTASDIPLYELVVEGDIFIDARVTQLDGLYVALPSSPTAGGNIYTCAFVSGASATLPTTTYQGGINNCKRQLVVNGAFAAKQIKFGRDCGSLIMSQNNEPTPSNYTGGTDAQSCNGSNHAAEVFNFMPEVWIRSASGGGKNTYDSISSLPPIL